MAGTGHLGRQPSHVDVWCGTSPGRNRDGHGGWVWDADPERDYRLNILLLHDDYNGGSAKYTAALATMGYNAGGLYPTVATDGISVLCAGCHSSNALPGTGLAGIPPLTTAVHGLHAYVNDPTNSMPLDSSDNRTACYRCHPGSDTRCLRGAMGKAGGADGFVLYNFSNGDPLSIASYSLPSAHITSETWWGQWPEDGLASWLNNWGDYGHMITIGSTQVDRTVT